MRCCCSCASERNPKCCNRSFQQNPLSFSTLHSFGETFLLQKSKQYSPLSRLMEKNEYACPERNIAIELLIENITKQYTPTHRGLSEFSLRIGPGILGLLGPNGAGKSTLMRILATTTRPTSGRVLWNGIDIRQSPNAVRETLGYLPQDFGVYPNLSAREFLEYIAAAKGLVGPSTSRRIDELLELVNLTEYKKRPL